MAHGDQEFQPVFITGPHRSGTTVLYRVLAESGCFNITTALHIVNRDRLDALSSPEGLKGAWNELNDRFVALGLRNRTFDAVPISPDIPEEYAYALEHQGRRPKLTEDNEESFIRFCRGVQQAQNPLKPLLLKNPYDADNFVSMASRFPQARFVFLFRHPFDIINSQIKAVRSLLAEKNEYVALVSPRYREAWAHPRRVRAARWLYAEWSGLLPLSTIRHVSQLCAYTVENYPTMGDAACSLTYAELCERPNETVKRVLDFLRLKPAREVDYSQWIQPREPQPLRELLQYRDRIERRNAAYIRTLLNG